MKRVLFILAFAFPLVAFYSKNPDNWKLLKDNNDIKVYSRQIEGTNRFEMRAETKMLANLSSLVAMITDVDYYPKWVYRCSNVKLLKKISDHEFYYYQITYLPWPMSDRDMVIHVIIKQEENTGKVNAILKGVPDLVPEKKEFVRVTIFDGEWEFIPLKNGILSVKHQFIIDAKGDVPNWLLNMAIVEGPFITMENMGMFKSHNQYANRKFDFLKEPV
jgi:ribosome-associated toxin RatA of RatAB toxin-antitoxin module